MKGPICIWSAPSLSAQRWVKWSLQPGTSLSLGAALGYLLKYSVCKPIKLPLLLFFSYLVVFNSLQPHGLQDTKLPCLLWSLGIWHLLKLMSIELMMPSNHFILCHPLLLLPSIFPASGAFPMSWLFISGGQSIGLQLHCQSFQWVFQLDFLLGLTSLICCPRDSQESSSAPLVKSISSLAFSLLYGPTLTPIHDYWKDHSFD